MIVSSGLQKAVGQRKMVKMPSGRTTEVDCSGDDSERTDESEEPWRGACGVEQKGRYYKWTFPLGLPDPRRKACCAETKEPQGGRDGDKMVMVMSERSENEKEKMLFPVRTAQPNREINFWSSQIRATTI